MDKIDELLDDYLVAINGFGKPDIARSALRAEYDRLQQENTMLHGAMAADDERLRVEGERAGVEHCGCDTAHWMADEILGLRKELDAMVKDRDSENRWANQYHHDMLDVKVELDALKERSGTCTWTASDDDEYWHTDCGQDFVLETGSPKENGMRYCSYCGKQLVEVIPPVTLEDL